MLDKTPVWKKFVKGIFLLMFHCIKVIQSYLLFWNSDEKQREKKRENEEEKKDDDDKGIYV